MQHFRKVSRLLLAIFVVGAVVLATVAGAQEDATPAESRGEVNVHFFPIIYNRFPAVPFQPTLVISVEDKKDFTLSWSDDEVVDQWQLQESTAANFPSDKTTTTVYDDDVTAVAFNNKSGDLYYRVRGVNVMAGPDLVGPWSNVINTTIQSFSGSFTVDSDSVTTSQCTTLRWNFTNVKAVFVQFGKGYRRSPVGGVDTEKVCPSVTTTYRAFVTLTDDSTRTFERTVTVSGSGCNIDPYINKFETNKTSVNEGEQFTLSWEVQCASRIFLEQTKILENGTRQVTEIPVVGSETRTVTFANDADGYEYRLKIFKRAPDDDEVIYSPTNIINQK